MGNLRLKCRRKNRLIQIEASDSQEWQSRCETSSEMAQCCISLTKQIKEKIRSLSPPPDYKKKGRVTRWSHVNISLEHHPHPS